MCVAEIKINPQLEGGCELTPEQIPTPAGMLVGSVMTPIF